MVPDLWWFTLQFFNLTMVPKCTYSVEIVLQILIFYLLVGGDTQHNALSWCWPGGEPQLSVNHAVVRVNSGYAADHSVPIQPFCLSLWLPYSINHEGKFRPTVDNSSVLSTLKVGLAKLWYSVVRCIKCISDLQYFRLKINGFIGT